MHHLSASRCGFAGCRARLKNQEPIKNLTPSAAASPPDVRSRLNQEPIKNLAPSAAASPPDVRRGSAPPSNSKSCRGCAPGSALPQSDGPKAIPGAQPKSQLTLAAGRSPASHPAAKPQHHSPERPLRQTHFSPPLPRCGTDPIQVRFLSLSDSKSCRLRPWFGLRPPGSGFAPELWAKGHTRAPAQISVDLSGWAEPRLTSGGEAATPLA